MGSLLKAKLRTVSRQYNEASDDIKGESEACDRADGGLTDHQDATIQSKDRSYQQKLDSNSLRCSRNGGSCVPNGGELNTRQQASTFSSKSSLGIDLGNASGSLGSDEKDPTVFFESLMHVDTSNEGDNSLSGDAGLDTSNGDTFSSCGLRNFLTSSDSFLNSDDATASTLGSVPSHMIVATSGDDPEVTTGSDVIPPDEQVANGQSEEKSGGGHDVQSGGQMVETPPLNFDGFTSRPTEVEAAGNELCKPRIVTTNPPVHRTPYSSLDQCAEIRELRKRLARSERSNKKLRRQVNRLGDMLGDKCVESVLDEESLGVSENEIIEAKKNLLKKLY